MKECFEESVLQEFLDGELNASDCAAVARHLGDCHACAASLAMVEDETANVFAALDQELNTLVPTQRLWTRISETIEVEKRSRGWFARFAGALSGFNVLSPASLAAICILVIVGVVSSSILLRYETPTDSTASRLPPVRQNSPAETVTPPISTATVPKRNSEEPTVPETVAMQRQRPTVQRAVYSEIVRRDKPGFSNRVTANRYVDGEEAFVSTITRLERTANSNKDEVLRPSARFAYEKDMAVVDATITRMKAEIRKNPANGDAKEILFASYRNKIELLRSVNERSELVAGR